MSIEFKCAGCGNTLRVPDEHAGRQAKCPVCEQLSTVPQPTSQADAVTSYPGEQPTPPVERPAEASAGGESPTDSADPKGGNADEAAAATPNPYAAPTQDPYARPLMKSHRGGVILTLGILSLLCCGLLGIPAWLMANEDLTQMERGVMDPTGRGLTTAGKVLGIIALILMAIGVLAQFSLTLVNA